MFFATAGVKLLPFLRELFVDILALFLPKQILDNLQIPKKIMFNQDPTLFSPISTIFNNSHQKVRQPFKHPLAAIHIKSTQIRANTSVALITSTMNSHAKSVFLLVISATSACLAYSNSYEGALGCRMIVPTVSYGMIPQFMLTKDFTHYRRTENSTIFRFGIVGMDALFNFAAAKYPTSGETINQIGKSLVRPSARPANWNFNEFFAPFSQ
jgi:hypothetical protein